MSLTTDGVRAAAAAGEGIRSRLLAGTALLGMLAVELNFTVLVALVPFIARDLDASPGTIAWIATGPLILRGVMQPLAGGFADVVELRKLWSTTCAVAIVGWAMAAAATDATTLIVWRTVAAVAETLLVPWTLLILARTYAPARRGRLLGYWAAIMALAPLLGLLAGAWAMTYGSWRIVLLLQVPIGLAALALGFFALRGLSAAAERRFDLAGALCLALALGPFVLFMTEGPDWGWLSPASLAAVAVSAAGAAALLRVERGSADALIPLGLLREPRLRGSLVALAAANASFMCGFLISAFIVETMGYDGSVALVALAPRALMFGVTSLLADSWARRWPGARVCGAGLLCIASSLIVLAAMDDGSGYVHLLAGLALAGIGLGMVMPLATGSALAAAAEDRAGTVGGMTASTTSISAAVGVAFATAFVGTGAGEFALFTAPLLLGALLAVAALAAVRHVAVGA